MNWVSTPFLNSDVSPISGKWTLLLSRKWKQRFATNNDRLVFVFGTSELKKAYFSQINAIPKRNDYSAYKLQNTFYLFEKTNQFF